MTASHRMTNEEDIADDTTQITTIFYIYADFTQFFRELFRYISHQHVAAISLHI